MGTEEHILQELKIIYYINKKILLRTLMVFGFCLIFTGILVYHFSESYVTVGFSLVIGITLSILSMYFSIGSKPFLYEKRISKESDEEEAEFQSVMKME